MQEQEIYNALKAAIILRNRRIDVPTAYKVMCAMPNSIGTIAHKTGITRYTVRNYVNHLIDLGLAKTNIPGYNASYSLIPENVRAYAEKIDEVEASILTDDDLATAKTIKEVQKVVSGKPRVPQITGLRYEDAPEVAAIIKLAQMRAGGQITENTDVSRFTGSEEPETLLDFERRLNDSFDTRKFAYMWARYQYINRKFEYFVSVPVDGMPNDLENFLESVI